MKLSVARQIDLFILQQESRMRSRSSSLFTGYLSATPPQLHGPTQTAQPTFGKAAATAEPAPVNPISDSHRDTGAGEAPFLALVDTIKEAHSVSSRFTEAEQLALLIARGSDFAKLCAYAMKAKGVVVTRGTYSPLVSAGIAIPAGNFHNLTPRGRWIADQILREIAPKLGVEIRTRTVTRRGSGFYERGIKSKFNPW